MVEDKRSVKRHRVLKDGRIILPGSWVTYDCSIRDITEKGARIRLKSDTIALPADFELVFIVDGLAFPVNKKWRRGLEYGVEFTGQARKVTARIN